jgi:hypothetical protein
VPVSHDTLGEHHATPTYLGATAGCCADRPPGVGCLSSARTTSSTATNRREMALAFGAD